MPRGAQRRLSPKRAIVKLDLLDALAVPIVEFVLEKNRRADDGKDLVINRADESGLRAPGAQRPLGFPSLERSTGQIVGGFRLCPEMLLG